MNFVEKIFLGKRVVSGKNKCYNGAMKRIIETEGMCCKKCAERAEKKLMLLDGVVCARANFKKGLILVETSLKDDELKACVEEAGFSVKCIRERKGIFDR